MYVGFHHFQYSFLANTFSLMVNSQKQYILELLDISRHRSHSLVFLLKGKVVCHFHQNPIHLDVRNHPLSQLEIRNEKQNFKSSNFTIHSFQSVSKMYFSSMPHDVFLDERLLAYNLFRYIAILEFHMRKKISLLPSWEKMYEFPQTFSSSTLLSGFHVKRSRPLWCRKISVLSVPLPNDWFLFETTKCKCIKARVTLSNNCFQNGNVHDRNLE